MSRSTVAPIQFTRDELHLLRRRVAQVYVQRTPKVERLTDSILRKADLAALAAYRCADCDYMTQHGDEMMHHMLRTGHAPRAPRAARPEGREG